MGMTVQRRKDTRTPRVIMHRIADIRGGVSVKVSELGGDFLPEGAVLSAPDDKGMCHVVKVARVFAAVGASDESIKVKKGHNFAKGDFVMAKAGSVAYDITAIDTEGSKEFDTLTVSTAIGAVEKGGYIAEAAANATGTESALKYVPFAVNGTGRPFTPKRNVDTDAWVFAVTRNLALPDFIASSLKGIINY